MADLLEINFDPKYIVQDACPASRNAALKSFPDTNILMCYFHVLLNCKKNKLDIPNEQQHLMFKRYIHRLHMTTSIDHFRKYWKIFVNSLIDNCPSFINYFYNQWLKSNWKNWKAFSSPPGYACTNSPT